MSPAYSDGNMATSSLWITFSVAIIGGVFALAGVFLKEVVSYRISRRTMAYAVRAELIAVQEILERRNYVTFLQEQIAIGKSGRPMLPLNTSVTRDYFPVVGKAVEKIGVLPSEIATQLIRYYVFANAFIEDAVSAPSGPTSLTFQVAAYEETLGVLLDARTASLEVVSLIDRAYTAHESGTHPSGSVQGLCTAASAGMALSIAYFAAWAFKATGTSSSRWETGDLWVAAPILIGLLFFVATPFAATRQRPGGESLARWLFALGAVICILAIAFPIISDIAGGETLRTWASCVCLVEL